MLQREARLGFTQIMKGQDQRLLQDQAFCAFATNGQLSSRDQQDFVKQQGCKLQFNFLSNLQKLPTFSMTAFMKKTSLQYP